ncbi:DUF1893 domain-containing protein, partial [Patescibacteria group bacterium]
MKRQFEKFLRSSFFLEVWSGEKVVFQSEKHGILGLVEFIQKKKSFEDLIIFDKIIGRATALLLVYIRAKKVYGELGSERAAEVFQESNIPFYFQKTVPQILNKKGDDLC